MIDERLSAALWPKVLTSIAWLVFLPMYLIVSSVGLWLRLYPEARGVKRGFVAVVVTSIRWAVLLPHCLITSAMRLWSWTYAEGGRLAAQAKQRK